MIEFNYSEQSKSFALTKKDCIKLIDALKANYPEITFYDVPSLDNAFYISADSTKLLRDVANESEENAKKLADIFGLTIEQIKTIAGHCVFYGKDFSVPEIIAHELGHYENEVRGKLSFVAQKYLRPNTVIETGTRVGYKLLLLIDPSKTWITGVASLLNRIPQLYYERRASQKGMKLINKVSKKVKIDKKDIKSIKKSLGGAWGTYLWSTLCLPIAAVASSAFATHAMTERSTFRDMMNGWNRKYELARRAGSAIAGEAGYKASTRMWERSTRKMQKESGKRQVKILGIFNGFSNKFNKLSTITFRSKNKSSERKVNRIISNFKAKQENPNKLMLHKSFALAEPISESKKPKKNFHVVSVIEGNPMDPQKRVSVISQSAKTPQEAEKMVRDKNLGRIGATKYRQMRAFESPKNDFSAGLYKQTLDREVERSKQQR